MSIVNALYRYGSRISCLNLTLLHEWCDLNRLSNAYFDAKFKKTPFTPLLSEKVTCYNFVTNYPKSQIIGLSFKTLITFEFSTSRSERATIGYVIHLHVTNYSKSIDSNHL
jgi:hypothetical protein